MSSINRLDEGLHRVKARSSDYVMVARAAEILGVSQGTIRTWAADGKIPMHRNPTNNYRLFQHADLDEFLRIVAKPAQTGKTRNRKTSS